MAIVHQVLSAPDLDEVFNYANDRLTASTPDANDRMFKSWEAKWRREALEHYLKLGWSFIAREEGGALSKPKVVGFFLGQPFLFFRGQTQTLWVEHVEANDALIERGLVDVAVRIAREKHLQRVLFADAHPLQAALEPWKTEPLEQDIVVVKTTKG